MNPNLFSLFGASVETHADRPALVVDGETLTYRALGAVVDRWAWAINDDPGQQIACLVSRSETAYASILATLKCGKTYVPLNPNFPGSRNSQILELSGAKTIVVDQAGVSNLAEMALPDDITLLVADVAAEDVPAELRSRCTMIATGARNEHMAFAGEAAGDYAYILFTSGSTGTPKGVPVRHTSVIDYVEHLESCYSIDASDRFSQTFDLTFDLSVHDMFLCWQVGACLYSIPEKVLMGPAKFIKEHELTVWFSVPSLAQFMNRFRMLKPGAFPSLRLSLFCGEPLPTSVVRQWQLAAPESLLENIYGPTEATIGISRYVIPADPDAIEDLNGVVSIGQIFPTQSFCLTDDAGQKQLHEGVMHEGVMHEGELCVAGSQIADGYWNNVEKTAAQFVELPDKSGTWYRTGDLVQRHGDNLFYVGRIDFQVKIRGYRIELEELNHAIAGFAGTDLVFSVPFPVTDGVAESIYTFVSDTCELDAAEIISRLGEQLPAYMIPADVLFVSEFPLNSNGKIDRLRLTESISNDAR